MKRFMFFLFFSLSLSASAFAQQDTAFFDFKLGDFVIEFDIEQEADIDFNQSPWIIPEYGSTAFPAKFTEGKITLSHPSEIFRYTNAESNFIAAFWDANGSVHFTEPVTLKTPKTEIMLEHSFQGNFVNAIAKITGLEGANLAPYYNNEAYGEETFFVFHNTSLDFWEGDTYFSARSSGDDFTFEGSLFLENVMSKGILSFGVTLQDQFGIPRLADTELKWILNQEGLRAVSNPSKYGVFQVFWPDNDPATIKVLSLSGQELMRCHISSGEHVILDDLPTGMYLLCLDGYVPAKVVRGGGS